MEKKLIGYESLDLSNQETPQELKLFSSTISFLLVKILVLESLKWLHPLDILAKSLYICYLSICHDDWSLAQRLILRSCEPLPRRRCLAKTVHNPSLALFPESMRRPVGGSSVKWSGLGCKSFDCLKRKKLSRDCVGCFDIDTIHEWE